VLSDEERAALQGDIEASLQALARQDSTELSFWDRVSKPDGELAKALVSSTGTTAEITTEQVKEIARLYRGVMTITGTKREHDTVVGNLDFLSDMLTRNNQIGLATAIGGIRELVAPA
jgi:hypothetical protein